MLGFYYVNDNVKVDFENAHWENKISKNPIIIGCYVKFLLNPWPIYDQLSILHFL